MAAGAILRESRCPVVGIVGSVEIRKVAANAGSGRRGEVVIRVTLRAIEARVRAGESEAGEFRVIELRSQPAVHGMALLAVAGEAERGVAGIRGFLKVRGVA